MQNFRVIGRGKALIGVEKWIYLLRHHRFYTVYTVYTRILKINSYHSYDCEL